MKIIQKNLIELWKEERTMNSMSDETKALMEEHIGKHGVPIMIYMYKLLLNNGCKVVPSVPESTTSIWDATFEISKGKDLSSKFFFHNTFIEILCVDRDDDPLIFDPEILGPDGFDYISDKIAGVLKCRITLLMGLFDGKTVEQIYNENPDGFERIRMKKVDDGNWDRTTF